MRAVVSIAGLACWALFAGCYQPTGLECQFQCAGGVNGTCPSGLTCTTAGMCAAQRDDICPASDGGPGNDATTCGWPGIANVDPCVNGRNDVQVDLVVEGTSARILDTDDPETLGDLPVEDWTLQDGASVRAVAVLSLRDFVVDEDAMVTVRGQRPLIILVNRTATVAGKIDIVPSSRITCGLPTDGGEGIGGGGGGGGAGGSHGSIGGAGGHGAEQTGSDGNGGTAGLPGPVVGAATLVPLRPGCRGGNGGHGTLVSNDTADGGDGGLGGGALQISARTLLSVSGVITAGGGGGKSGSAADGAATPRSGAGGGGAGGAILLESVTVRLDGARLCANGGGGGGAKASVGGSDATSCAFASGAQGLPDGSNRGGAGAAAGTAGSGTAGAVSDFGGGGGGGGGGAGRLVIRGAREGEPAAVSPVPNQAN